MPKVQLPDGRWLEFKDEEREQVREAIRKKWPDAGQPRPTGPVQAAKDFAHGAAQSLGGTAEFGFRIGDLMGLPGIAAPIIGPTVGLAAIIPQDWRTQLTEFSNAPSQSTAQTLGYWGTELAPIGSGVKPAIAGVKGAWKVWQGLHPLAKEALIHGGGSLLHLPTSLTRIPGMVRALQEIAKTVAKEGTGEMGSELGSIAKEAAPTAAPKYTSKADWMKDWGSEGAKQKELELKLPQAKDVPPTGKPRVRIPAQTRQVPPPSDTND
jgi:hypothetical protein